VTDFFYNEMAHLNILVNHLLVFVESVRDFATHYISVIASFIHKQLLNIWVYLIASGSLHEMLMAVGSVPTFNEKDAELMRAIYTSVARSCLVLYYYARDRQIVTIFNESVDTFAEVNKATNRLANLTPSDFVPTSDHSVFNLKNEAYAELFLGIMVAAKELICNL
jgi:hypothetical protein